MNYSNILKYIQTKSDIVILKKNNFKFKQLRFMVESNKVEEILTHIKTMCEEQYHLNCNNHNHNTTVNILFFESLEEKQRYENALKLKHQTLGAELKLFFFDYKNSNLPFFLNNFMNIMAKLKHKIIQLLNIKHKYIFISTPKIYNVNLWKRTGHYDKFYDNLHILKNEKKILKPMSCPGACIVFQQLKMKEENFPVRFFEFGNVFRKELSGVQQGLKRLNNFTQDDQHIFVHSDQLFDEIHVLINHLLSFYFSIFRKQDVKFFISTKPKLFSGDEKEWVYTINLLKKTLSIFDVEFEIDKYEGAFYGPKIDVKVIDNSGQAWQLGTIQIDVNTSSTLSLSKHKQKKIYIIHSAILGSLERSLAVMLEYFKGFLPFWLFPRIMVINKSNTTLTSQQMFEWFKMNDIEINFSKEHNLSRVKYKALTKKIRLILIYKGNYEIEIIDVFNNQNKTFKNINDFKQNFSSNEF